MSIYMSYLTESYIFSPGFQSQYLVKAQFAVAVWLYCKQRAFRGGSIRVFLEADMVLKTKLTEVGGRQLLMEIHVY